MVLNPSRGNSGVGLSRTLQRDSTPNYGEVSRCLHTKSPTIHLLESISSRYSGLGTRTNHMYERYTFTCRARWVSGGMDRWCAPAERCACLWCLWADGALNPLMDCCFLSLPPQNNLTIPCVGLVVDIFLVCGPRLISLSLSLSVCLSLCVCVCLCVLLCFSPLLSRVGWQTLNTTLLCC